MCRGIASAGIERAGRFLMLNNGKLVLEGSTGGAFWCPGWRRPLLVRKREGVRPERGDRWIDPIWSFSAVIEDSLDVALPGKDLGEPPVGGRLYSLRSRSPQAVSALRVTILLRARCHCVFSNQPPIGPAGARAGMSPANALHPAKRERRANSIRSSNQAIHQVLARARAGARRSSSSGSIPSTSASFSIMSMLAA